MSNGNIGNLNFCPELELLCLEFANYFIACQFLIVLDSLLGLPVKRTTLSVFIARPLSSLVKHVVTTDI